MKYLSFVVSVILLSICFISVIHTIGMDSPARTFTECDAAKVIGVIFFFWVAGLATGYDLYEDQKKEK